MVTSMVECCDVGMFRNVCSGFTLFQTAGTIKLFIYLTDVLHYTQEYFTNPTTASLMVGGNWA